MLVPKRDSWVAAVGSNKREAQVPHMSAATSTLVPAARGLDATESVNNNDLNQRELPVVGSPQVSLSANEKQPFEPVEVSHLKIAGECPVAEKSHVSESAPVVKSSSSQGIDQLRGTCCSGNLFIFIIFHF